MEEAAHRVRGADDRLGRHLHEAADASPAVPSRLLKRARISQDEQERPGRAPGRLATHFLHSEDVSWLSGYTLGKVNSALRSNPPTHVGTVPSYLQ